MYSTLKKFSHGLLKKVSKILEPEKPFEKTNIKFEADAILEEIHSYDVILDLIKSLDSSKHLLNEIQAGRCVANQSLLDSLLEDSRQRTILIEYSKRLKTNLEKHVASYEDKLYDVSAIIANHSGLPFGYPKSKANIIEKLTSYSDKHSINYQNVKTKFRKAMSQEI